MPVVSARATRAAGDLLVDAGHGHRERCIAPTLSAAVTAVGALSNPGVVGRLRDRHREGDQPMPAPGDVVDARWRRHRLRPGDLRHHCGEVLAPESPVARRDAGPWLAASATWPGLRTTAGVAAAAGPAETVQPTMTVTGATRRCHGDGRTERRGGLTSTERF